MCSEDTILAILENEHLKGFFAQSLTLLKVCALLRTRITDSLSVSKLKLLGIFYVTLGLGN